MDTARIAELLEPFLKQPLQESQLNQISMYIDLLKRWNARINLTAIRNEEEIVTRHFGESLFMARHLFPPVPNQCHPERSHVMREAHGEAESKDPYTSSVLAPPQGILPEPVESAARPRHRLRRRIPRSSSKNLGPQHPSNHDRIESQESRLPARSGPSPYIDQHQCNHRASRNPGSTRRQGFPPVRRSNSTSRRAIQNHPPPSRNLSSTASPFSCTNRNLPSPRSDRSDNPRMELAN